MVEVLIGIGSNLEPESALRVAIAALRQRFGRVLCSSVYSSPAAGPSAADYLNMVVQVATGLEVDPLRADLAAIETATGRTREDPRICRLDLDLLAYGGRVDGGQRLPRQGLYSLPFVLVPLAEIAPWLLHPLTGERCSAALASAQRSPELRVWGELATVGT
ncbi:MAG: 2-amino-4-hydroxy-6-hydroxymethyldihydropteridine diphosphokinase [Gammaproteobacteria bacterium]